MVTKRLGGRRRRTRGYGSSCGRPGLQRGVVGVGLAQGGSDFDSGDFRGGGDGGSGSS